jgi:hypothetical protein
MRLYGISDRDVETVISGPLLQVADERGNRRLTGLDLDGRAIIVVIAGDDPDFVITTFVSD